MFSCFEHSFERPDERFPTHGFTSLETSAPKLEFIHASVTLFLLSGECNQEYKTVN